MGYSNYWKRKAELEARARKHTEEVENLFKNEINSAIVNSIICERTDDGIKCSRITGEEVEFSLNDNLKTSTIKVIDGTTQDGIFTSEYQRITILNFASYKNPGGMFISGSSAQEEMLCHSSFLYNVLSKFQLIYYEVNKTHLRDGLFTDKAIFTPNVLFFDGRGNKRFANVLTCAAPNKSLMFKYHQFTESDNALALKSRTDFMWRILNAFDDQHNEVVLGAWGCGVYKQNPYEVANLLVSLFSHSVYDTVTFAIPSGENYDAFVKLLNDKGIRFI